MTEKTTPLTSLRGLTKNSRMWTSHLILRSINSSTATSTLTPRLPTRCSSRLVAWSTQSCSSLTRTHLSSSTKRPSPSAERTSSEIATIRTSFFSTTLPAMSGAERKFHRTWRSRAIQWPWVWTMATFWSQEGSTLALPMSLDPSSSINSSTDGFETIKKITTKKKKTPIY